MPNRRIQVRPGRAQSVLGLIVGLVFVGVGCFVVIPSAGPFGIFWTLIAAAITVVNGMNAFGKKGVITGEIVINDDNYTDSYENSLKIPGNFQERTPEARLMQLQELYEKRLITTEEYERKREEILKLI